MSETNDYEDLEDEWEDEERYCDYGYDTSCVDPEARDFNCCLGCFLYDRTHKEILKEASK